jgi:hypothetical protein
MASFLLRQFVERGFELFRSLADFARELAVFRFKPGLVHPQFAVFVTERRVFADELFKLRFEAVEFSVHKGVLAGEGLESTGFVRE